MKRLIKILLLALMCTISWYGGMLSQPNPINQSRMTFVMKTDDGRLPIPEDIPKEGDVTVFITRTGTKYHVFDCPYLKSCIETTLEGAKKYYERCEYCDPPR